MKPSRNYSLRHRRADGLRLLNREAPSLKKALSMKGVPALCGRRVIIPNGLDFGQTLSTSFDDLPTIGEVTTPPWAEVIGPPT